MGALRGPNDLGFLLKDATAATYTPVTADEGQYLRATVAYTDKQWRGQDGRDGVRQPGAGDNRSDTRAGASADPGGDACTHAGAYTGTAHADTGTTHADTGTTHADTGTTHADTGTAYADTGTSHANTGTTHADTGTADTDGYTRARGAASRPDPCAYGDCRPDPCAYGRRDTHADPGGGRRGRGRVPSVGDHSDSDRSSGSGRWWWIPRMEEDAADILTRQS